MSWGQDRAPCRMFSWSLEAACFYDCHVQTCFCITAWKPWGLNWLLNLTGVTPDVYIQGEWQLLVNGVMCVRQDSSLLPLIWWQHLCWLLSPQLVVRSLTFPSETEQQLIAEYFATAFRIRITEHCYLWHKALGFFPAVLLLSFKEEKYRWRVVIHWKTCNLECCANAQCESQHPSCVYILWLHVFGSLKEWFLKREFITAGFW